MTAKAPQGDDEIARLIAVPLGDFVEERKKLAASLKSLGRRDEAQAVAKLPKPSSALWAVNQVARREPAAIRRLAELTAAMQGPRHASDDYAALVAEHRDVLRSLRAAAEQVLVDAKIGVNPALLEKVIHTLRAGMADDQARAAIERARLLHDIGEVDFASLVGAGAPAAAPRIEKATTPRHSTEQAPRAVETATGEEKARAREAEAKAREEERERARARAAAAREAEQLRGQADAARKRVRDEERAIEAARRALADGEARLAKARAESDQLESALEAALAAARESTE